MIEAFILSGHYPKGVHICREGSDEWGRHYPKNECPRPPVASQAIPQRKTPAKAGTPKSVFVGCGILFLVSIFMVIASAQRQSSSSNAPIATPRYMPKHTSSLPSPEPTATSDNRIYTDAQGNSFRVSNSDFQRLSLQRDALVQEQDEISTIRSKLDAYAANLGSEETYLDGTSQAAIDAYNAKVEKLNNENAQMNSRLRTFNAEVDSFNAELARVGTPMH